MRFRAGVLIATGLTLVASQSCARDAKPDQSLTVLAASSLTDVGPALTRNYAKASNGANLRFTFAASSTLVAQLSEGAPGDVLLTADDKTMDNAAAHVSRRVAFATNRLAIAVAPGNPRGIQSIADLARDGVTFARCLDEVPCGRAASTALSRAHIDHAPRTLEPNVKAVVSKVVLGEVDAGIVYVTDAKSAGPKVQRVDIPDEANVETRYQAAVLRDAPHPGDASRFIAYLTGREGQRLLAEYGFLPPPR